MRVAVWARALIVGASLVLAAPAQAQTPELILGGDGREAPLVWQEALFGDQIEPHAALLLPVSVAGSPKTLYMQFDLGAPNTVLMKDKLDSLVARLPGLTVGADGRVDSFAFTMGEVQAEARNVRVHDAGSSDPVHWDDPAHVDVIGTVGADLLRGRVLIIDYAGQRMFVETSVPEAVASVAQMQEFVFTPRGVVLTGMAIDGEDRNIMLDTGSSAFALLVTREEWLAKAVEGAATRSFPVNSWGRTLTAHIAPTHSVAAFGDTVVPLGEVAYIEGVSEAQTNAMRAIGMGGMTGNKLFVDRILVLDAVNSAYAVVAPHP